MSDTNLPLPVHDIDGCCEEMSHMQSPLQSLSSSLQLAASYKRSTEHRIFVNRKLALSKIDVFGFDMDYTLCMYQWPLFDELLFYYMLDAFIGLGYPKELGSRTYDASFPSRGLWYDKQLGTFLKVDISNYILLATIGSRVLDNHEVRRLYPNRFITISDRIYIMNTPFTLSENMFFASVIDHLVDKDSNYMVGQPSVNVVGRGNVSFLQLYRDFIAAINIVHDQQDFKNYVIENLHLYVVKDKRVPDMLNSLRQHGRKTFLLTNSEFYYTDKVMTYLFDFKEFNDWKSYFDVIIVNSSKPSFFEKGKPLGIVNTDDGSISPALPGTQIEPGIVYSGGCSDNLNAIFSQSSSKSILYVGDHIYGDILKSKKRKGWRTFLIVPELDHELALWVKNTNHLQRLYELDVESDRLYANVDAHSASNSLPEGLAPIRKEKSQIASQIDRSYGKMGSLFHHGSRLTFYSGQVQRYADVYATSCVNILYYPLNYIFKSPRLYMPHELTVSDFDDLSLEEYTARKMSTMSSSRAKNRPVKKRLPNLIENNGEVGDESKPVQQWTRTDSTLTQESTSSSDEDQ